MTHGPKSPEEVYRQQVAAITGAKPATSTYVPGAERELFVRNRRIPKSLDGLAPIERRQLEKMFRGQDRAALLATGMMSEGGEEDFDDSYPLDLEMADVVDADGTLQYRLYGMNYGAMFLMHPDALECVAFASQHDVERWSLAQRDLFWAMDRAMRRGDHGFQQPVSFDWANDGRWAPLVGTTPGTVASEPYVRKQFSDEE